MVRTAANATSSSRAVTTAHCGIADRAQRAEHLRRSAPAQRVAYVLVSRTGALEELRDQRVGRRATCRPACGRLENSTSPACRRRRRSRRGCSPPRSGWRSPPATRRPGAPRSTCRPGWQRHRRQHHRLLAGAAAACRGAPGRPRMLSANASRKISSSALSASLRQRAALHERALCRRRREGEAGRCAGWLLTTSCRIADGAARVDAAAASGRIALGQRLDVADASRKYSSTSRARPTAWRVRYCISRVATCSRFVVTNPHPTKRQRQHGERHQHRSQWVDQRPRKWPGSAHIGPFEYSTRASS